MCELTDNQESFIFLLHHRAKKSHREIVEIVGLDWWTVAKVIAKWPLEPPLTTQDEQQIAEFMAMSDSEWAEVRAEVRASLPTAEESDEELDGILADLWLTLGRKADPDVQPLTVQ